MIGAFGLPSHMDDATFLQKSSIHSPVPKNVVTDNPQL